MTCDHRAVVSERLGVGMLLWPGASCQGHQEETPGPKPGEAKSPETTEQNEGEAHRA